jgi:single-strand DNA-binding protein
MDLNKVMIIGRLTRDPELRTTPTGTSVCQLGLATNFVYTNQQSGQKVENVEYHNVVMWRKLGEIAAQYLKKGQRVYIEGRLQTRSWDGDNGKKNYKTEIIADNMIMLDGGRGGEAGAPMGGANNGGGFNRPSVPAANNADEQSYPIEELPTIQQGEDINVDDIPF